MEPYNCNDIYHQLKTALKKKVEEHRLNDEKVSISCSILTAKEAIGSPEDQDYPIIKGREKMIEAVFKGARGQVFTDEYRSAEYTVDELLRVKLDSNRGRAHFIAALNAVYRYLGLCEHTVHCKDTEPRECAGYLSELIDPDQKVLLVGCQPRFLEYLASHNRVRAVDLDVDNIGKEKFGITIEPPEMTGEAVKWCDLIFATGSTIINCTIGDFLNSDRPVIFYGVTISAPAKILGLRTFCAKGR